MIRKLMPSIVLLLILAAAAGYAYSQNFFQKEDTPAADPRLLTMNVSDIDRIDIQPVSAGNAAAATNTSASSADPSSVQLYKKGQTWSMTAPAAYPVNPYTIQDWLKALQSATIHGTVEEQPADTSKYGIHGNTPVFAVQGSGGDKLTLAIGSELPTKGYYYAQLNGSSVIQLSQQTVTDLQADAFQFIDTTPIGWDDNQLTQLKWNSTQPEASWTLDHTPNIADPAQDTWTLNGKSIAGDQGTGITDAVKNMPTDQLPVPAAQVKSYDKVLTLRVSLTTDGKATTQHYEGWQNPKNKGYIWLTDPQNQWAYRVSMDNLTTAAQSAKRDAAKSNTSS
ncbi:DUF4340 domain-containing protein [Paenibacillus bovis]|uniref:DUF4340 domain-containing protein n=1 Tax=Paenibacillus bovis TaxID=1616788 RepID=A0A172ZKG0_9BACL|nr:DUF4340 domain-containing protein [Paenibacillus bovis]ANF98116.1 hypothetical protein AR543_20300 [Paenibacillus bovis]